MLSRWKEGNTKLTGSWG